MKKTMFFLSALLISSAVSAQVTVSPLTPKLEKKTARINITNHGEKTEVFVVEKGAEWMLVAPSRLTIRPGEMGAVKVGRSVDRGAEEVSGFVTLRREEGGSMRFKVVVPAAK